MNTANIKKYAPKARKDFIAAMTRQAARLGVTAKGIEPMELRGDLALIGDRAFPRTISRARDALARRVQQLGFAQAMDQAAYSWFNRLCAIRYMEIQGYLDHGRRVLSTASGEAGTPQILDDCLDIDLDALDSSLDRQKITELKLDGTKDEALYRELLLAQCHALHQAMPFLFEAVDDATELLLPDNLTKTDSLVRELVSAIPEEDWSNIEIIGWLYQFYISEKKEQVIGKVVKSEDIPAATQLFTPNWIVQYLVQNSVGRQWLQTYPDSPLQAQMPYYIALAEQTEEVQAQLAAVTPASIEPESIKVLDPACGSGHILIEAYKVLKAIYEERGYRSRDIPALILTNNLFGLDIDDRAGQLAGFALLMLARKDDRRLFGRVAAGEVKLNVLALEETGHLDLPGLWQALNLTGGLAQGSSDDLFGAPDAPVQAANDDPRYSLLERTLARFVEAKTFGSLIEVPATDAEPLKALLLDLEELANKGDSMQKPAAEVLVPYVQQAWILAQRYDAVIANPPYMGGKYQTPAVKKYLKDHYKGYEKDLFSAFIIRNLDLANDHGQLGFMTPFVWMFISSYEQLRTRLIDEDIITTLVQLEYSGFDGATVPICTFTLNKGHIQDYKGCYIRLSDFRGAKNQGPKTLEAIKSRDCGWFYEAKPDDFKKIPSSPVAYWVKETERNLYESNELLSQVSCPRKGLDTGENEVFLRYWHEVDLSKCCFDNSNRTSKWFPYNKGGNYRRWYGNREYVINWERDGSEIKSRLGWDKKKPTIRNSKHYFQSGMTWTTVSSGGFSARYSPEGALFDNGGCTLFSEKNLNVIGAFINSSCASRYLEFLSPTLNFQPGDIGRILYPKNLNSLGVNFEECVYISKSDWDKYEISWDYSQNELMNYHSFKISEACSIAIDEGISAAQRLRKLEELNNNAFSKALNLDDEISTKVKIEKISLFSNPYFRNQEDDGEEPIKLDQMKTKKLRDLVSHVIGCIMGRYSFDREGLVYAHAGNKGFAELVKEGAYQTFPADDDGILPLTDLEWFPDDASNRFLEFVATVWGEDNLQQNLDFVAESLCLHAIKPKRGESAMDTIRRYLSTQFYKDHLKTYKKRPIYWLFSSGKQKAFECLVYLHRYNEGTLARMRTEYVIPLTAKLATYVDKLEQDKDASSSAAETKRLEKEIAALHKQQAELASFDEKLRHYADMRISLDLDDGVKVNYGKFGDLLANVKDVTGNKAD